MLAMAALYALPSFFLSNDQLGWALGAAAAPFVIGGALLLFARWLNARIDQRIREGRFRRG